MILIKVTNSSGGCDARKAVWSVAYLTLPTEVIFRATRYRIHSAQRPGVPVLRASSAVPMGVVILIVTS